LASKFFGLGFRGEGKIRRDFVLVGGAFRPAKPVNEAKSTDQDDGQDDEARAGKGVQSR